MQERKDDGGAGSLESPQAEDPGQKGRRLPLRGNRGAVNRQRNKGVSSVYSAQEEARPLRPTKMRKNWLLFEMHKPVLI